MTELPYEVLRYKFCWKLVDWFSYAIKISLCKHTKNFHIN